MYVITGGAGFIGSNIAASLDAEGADIAIIDWLGSDDCKWRNIAKRRLVDIVPPEAGAAFLEANRSAIRGVVHMGAISTTTETDVDAIVRNNFRQSVDHWTFCARHEIPFVYASSAATYGDGGAGFLDRFDADYFQRLRPLNPYGWSKHVFDRWVLDAVETGKPTPPRWAGLKFFNVYGPNEYHKGGQRSVAVQLHAQIRERGAVRLFRSDNPDYADGEQLRDFVWVGDCVDVARWALEDAAAPSGLYNVGSGVARSFADKARIAFREMGLEPRIEFIDLPANLKGKYQYYTCASTEKLRAAGFTAPLTSLEEGLRRYIGDYLETADRFR
ncbi:MAG: ADP-glyceromanno-heptose 6-epimerase [Hyphomicrobiales bacterium]|nr:ADP-glyceromanno-heptose 6-epimerase [Hyphomicrobiales bacterium]MBV8662802.1 ADP-glyceromanno-heptose 6-epimerase [Hyphomicrobiales bacterium]